MVFDELNKKLKSQKIHFCLIDPDKQKTEEIAELIKKADKAGTDAFMVGGSSSTVILRLDETIKKIKEISKLPVILFPSTHAGISRFADAIFFMSLLNSRTTIYLIDEQVRGAPLVKTYGMEAIPMAYLIFESGNLCAAQFVSDAKLLPCDKPEFAVAYSLAAQYMGMKIVYLEAGSGAKIPVSNETISAVRKNIDIPIVVGGGLKNKEIVNEKLKAGADIIVTGTVNEGNLDKMVEIIKEVKGFKV
jgi:phosphoglycerol geranylgeranyltransferase